MPITKDVEKIEALFKAFFNDIFSREHLQEGFAKLDKTIGITYRDPDMKFALVCRKNDAKFILNVDGEIQPDVTITMDWETAHKFWMDDLDLLSALLTRSIILTGDFTTLYNLRPLFKETSSIYQKLASEHLDDDGNI
jgi:putative sterol carrier protein